MRCPGCGKFPSFDTSAEPEVDLDDITVELEKPVDPDPESVPAPVDPDQDQKPELLKGQAVINGTVRIVLCSECCGEECKEATFDVELYDVDVEKVAPKTPENPDGCTCTDDEWADSIEAEADSAEMTDRTESFKEKTYKIGPKKGQTVRLPIPGRFQKTFYGAQVHVVLKCGCGKEVGSADWSDEIQAGSMDELG